jgi:subtilisin family serine protease
VIAVDRYCGRLAPVLFVLLAACAGPPAPSTAPAPSGAAIPDPRALSDDTAVLPPEPALPPRLAMYAGLMPLRSIGADAFRASHPTFDGRGTLIAILDSGIDAALPGFQRTTTGERKLADVRDFSGEGRIALEPVYPYDGTVRIDDQVLAGFEVVAGRSAGPYYGGVFREIVLGSVPSGDVNGDGDIDDAFGVVVARASEGWVAFIDASGDSSLADERPLRDYAVAPGYMTFRRPDGTAGPVTVALNLTERDGQPVLDLVMDNSSHGSHVAGIAAGHDMFGLEGFDGVAPGAQLLALKIANNARGGISVTGSMLGAMKYAAEYATARDLPLIVNLSYGVGNEIEGTAVIDSLVDEFATAHPEVLVVISAGNDGPGLSTVGFPGSASLALAVCALFPGVFAEPPQPGQAPPRDVLGWWSARGGEVAKPDVCAPGVAYSNVPAWRTGEEVSGGTSMAAPQIAGAAALLVSGLRQVGTTARAVDIKRALITTAAPIGGTTVLDGGTGVADVPSAFRWLRAGHQSGAYRIRALPDGGNTSHGSAAFRRSGLAAPDDTVQTFVVRSVGGQPAARLLLRPDVPWLSSPSVIEPGGQPVTVRVTYDADQLREPGVYVGTVWARPATDTIGGASFGLTNTIVVPYRLAQPFEVSGMLTPGATARYFLAVPDAAASLVVRVDLGERTAGATLYLFEPGGLPHRNGSSAQAGAGRRSAEILVAREDLRAGVYEAVVIAPPTQSAAYRLRAAVPVVRLTPAPDVSEITLENGAAGAIAGSATARAVGTRYRRRLSGTHDGRRMARLAVPDSVDAMRLEVNVPERVWRQLTDFGVTVFDAVGHKLSDGPMHYTIGRQTVRLDKTAAGDTVLVELAPAFADPLGEQAWEAELVVDFFRVRPVDLLADTSPAARFTLAPGATRSLAFSWPADSLAGPWEGAPVVEYRVELDDGSPIRATGTAEPR